MTLRVLVPLALLVLVAYGLIEAGPLLAGPVLLVATPADGASIEGGVLTVSGNARRIVALTLDGVPVLPDEQGNFSTTLALSKGTSILTFAARDRFGRDVRITRTVIVP